MDPHFLWNCLTKFFSLGLLLPITLYKHVKWLKSTKIQILPSPCCIGCKCWCENQGMDWEQGDGQWFLRIGSNFIIWTNPSNMVGRLDSQVGVWSIENQEIFKFNWSIHITTSKQEEKVKRKIRVVDKIHGKKLEEENARRVATEKSVGISSVGRYNEVCMQSLRHNRIGCRSW